MQASASPLVIYPERAATACVIWLHGLGADGNDFAPIVAQLGLADDNGIVFVFPHAPHRPVTINGGFVMPAWYDIDNPHNLGGDTRGLAQSCQSILQLAGSYAKDLGWNKLVLAGFSQGAAVVAHMLEHLTQPVAGLICLSGYSLHQLRPACDQQGTHALVCHGNFDQVVPPALGAVLAERLGKAGLEVEQHNYTMGHQVCIEQIGNIGVWLQQRLGGHKQGAADG